MQVAQALRQHFGPELPVELANHPAPPLQAALAQALFVVQLAAMAVVGAGQQAAPYLQRLGIVLPAGAARAFLMDGEPLHRKWAKLNWHQWLLSKSERGVPFCTDTSSSPAALHRRVLADDAGEKDWNPDGALVSWCALIQCHAILLQPLCP